MSGIHYNHLYTHIIVPTLKYLGMESKVAALLLLGTAQQESRCGKYLKQVQGPALGVWQIEPATHHDIYENYLSYRPTMRKLIKGLSSHYSYHSEQYSDDDLVSNLKYACAIARLIYFRVSEPLPSDANDIDALAIYWKLYYNTTLGKGTIEEFVRNYNLLK